MDHWSLDLETLDTAPSAVILSIGLVRFNPETGEILHGVEYVLNRTEQRDEFGRTESESTLAWWEQQSEEARRIFDAVEVVEAGEEQDGTGHNDAMLRHIAALLNSNSIVWGNGSDFDNVLLASLFASYDIKLPWRFYNNRCLRTLKSITSLVGPVPNLPREGTHHNALADAIYQAQTIAACLRTITAFVEDGK